MTTHTYDPTTGHAYTDEQAHALSMVDLDRVLAQSDPNAYASKQAASGLTTEINQRIEDEIDAGITDTTYKPPTGSIAFVDGPGRPWNGFSISWSYPTALHAAEPLAWHITALLALCIPVPGAEVAYHDDGTVLVTLHVGPTTHYNSNVGGEGIPPGLEVFLLHANPHCLSFGYLDVVLSVAHRAALAAIENEALFYEVAGVVREGIKNREGLIFPPPSIPCDASESLRRLRLPAAREAAAATRARSKGAPTTPPNPDDFA
jgi:hypothetical protein